MYFIDMAFHRARRIRKQASFRLWFFFVTVFHIRARGFVHVYQTERSLFTNSSSSMEGHINKVIFSVSASDQQDAILSLFIWPSIELEEFIDRLLSVCAGFSEWQLQLMKLRCFKIV